MVADALGDAALDLAPGEDGVDDLADLLQGVEVGDLGCVGESVNGDLGDVDGPGIGGGGGASGLVVVPENVGGDLVAGFRDERAVVAQVSQGGGFEFGGGVVGEWFSGGNRRSFDRVRRQPPTPLRIRNLLLLGASLRMKIFFLL